MKYILPLSLLFLSSVHSVAQTIEDANLSVSNIDNNCWFESYDDSKRTISNLNFMALCDGNNSEYRTNPFVIKLYLYNKEKYEATQEVYYIKTYEVPYMKHFASWEVKNANINFCDIDVEPGVYRLGFYVDADNQIKESDENDNMVLFQGELNIGEKKCTGSTTPTTEKDNTTTDNTTSQDPDQALKDQKLSLENQLVDLTKKITALELDLNQNKATLAPVDLKIKELEKQELELRREECKTAIERTNKSLNKTLTTEGLQSYTTKEQEYKLKADALQKQRTELTSLKNQNAVYSQQVHDYPILVNRHKTDLSGMTQLNKIDSINYKIKTLEIEETSYKYEAAKIGLDRTTKLIENSVATGSKPHTETHLNELKTKEEEYTKSASSTSVQIQEQLRLKKEAEKEARKDANQVKIDNSKLKIKIQSMKSELGMKEKALAKEQKKKKQNSAKIETLQKEIEQLKKDISEAEKQIQP